MVQLFILSKLTKNVSYERHCARHVCISHLRLPHAVGWVSWFHLTDEEQVRGVKCLAKVLQLVSRRATIWTQGLGLRTLWSLHCLPVLTQLALGEDCFPIWLPHSRDLGMGTPYQRPTDHEVRLGLCAQVLHHLYACSYLWQQYPSTWPTVWR